MVRLPSTANRRTCPRVRTVAAAVAAAATTLAGLPGVAAAHPGSQPIPDAAYYRADLAEVVPAPAGVRVRVDPAGEWIELTDGGPAEVIVFGYAREPYLRITSTTVQENQLSQTTYLNRSLFADSVPTAPASGNLAPVWRTIGSAGSVRWHDHRIHWMGQARPPAVDADPRHPHPVGDWTVHATAAGRPFEIHGSLRWLGKPDAANAQPVPGWLLWIVESMALVILVLLGLVVRQHRRGRRRNIPTPTG
ncbi:hypothetical protein ACFFWC_10830 [Plantactinospora siamensis]|uniref:Uncharacterized protein n=1 Tax=Plantactinospora siamensis TaxID=555372 RepID=A0ABV6P0C8_9ACTN